MEPAPQGARLVALARKRRQELGNGSGTDSLQVAYKLLRFD
jgi:hypothetical protein